MKIYLLTLIVFMASCAKQGQEYIKPGITSLYAVILKEGSPEEVKKSQINKSRDIVSFKNFSLQAKGEKVEAVFRDPEKHETSLQYWRHLYKSRKTKFNKVENQGHEEIWQLEIPEEKTIITYNKSSNLVTGITRHE